MKRPTLLAIVFSLAFGALATLPGGVAPVANAEDAPEAAAEKLLGSGDWKDRLKGLEALEALGKSPRTEKLAIHALADDDWGVEIRALKALEKIGSDAGRDAAVRLAVEGEIQWVRDAAVDAAKALGAEKSADRLLDVARDIRDERLRARAVEAAGRMAWGPFVKRFRAFVHQRDLGVEAAGIKALGPVGRDPAGRDEALKLLHGALALRDDRKHFLGYAAVLDALGAVADASSVERLVGEIAQLPDDDPYAPERIARSLAKADAATVAGAIQAALLATKDPAAKRRLARLVGRLRCVPRRAEVEALLEHRDERVRSEAARTLGILADEASAPVLSKALLEDRSTFVRVEAVTALARTRKGPDFRGLTATVRADPADEVRLQYVVELADAGDPAAIPELETLVADRAWRVASAALASIGTLGTKDDLPRVLPTITARDWRVRAAAFEALGRLRAAVAIPYLTDGLTDKDPVVKGVCHANLQILTGAKQSADASLWRAWWLKNGDGLVLIKRSRRTAKEKESDPGEKDRYASGTYTRQKGVEILQKARILVVTGAWDHAEKVLDHLAIRYTLLRAQQLKTAGLNPNQVVLVNCEGNVDKEGAERLQWFVNVGGYLMSTDWAVTKAIADCFPGYVKQFSGSTTGNDVVVVEEAMHDHPFMQGIFDNVPAMMWWLEIQAFPITVEYPERTDVLVDSAAMRQRFGSSPMAVAFRYGLGKVQHSVSHFYLQEEGMTKAAKPRDRMIFAADNLGLSLDTIRTLSQEGRWEGAINEATMKEIAPDYSMFRLIVNVVAEKSRWVEGL